jgi:hypothetical protein
MAKTVNLDALIIREDFLATAQGIDAGQSGKNQASRTDLTAGESFYITLRKPDFQRETAAWTPESVKDFIKAFADGELIPSVICWQSEQRLTFVIDGAHRLSAIMAWLQDDYGDGDASIKFYNNQITDEQRAIAKKTRELVNTEVGSWKNIRAESSNPGSTPHLTLRSRSVAHSIVPLLWVRGQDSKKAENAFLTINRSGVQIDPTELRILSSRFKPEAIAARAIVRNSSGHVYWHSFSPTGQQDLEASAKAIYKALYSPVLDTSVKSVELPIAGHGYGTETLPLIFDFVNIANGLQVIDASKGRKVTPMERVAPDEATTLAYMTKAEQLVKRITGTHASSLGLLPAVYFYSTSNRHQPTAVLAVAALICELETTEEFLLFTESRRVFEDFLVAHKSFINQLTTKNGSMAKGYKQMKDYLLFVLRLLQGGKSESEGLDSLPNHSVLRYLAVEDPINSTQAKAFSTKARRFSFITEAITNAAVCDLCGSRLDSKSIQLGHVIDKSKGGVADLDNGKWEHPFCNSTYKPWLEKEGRL